jgi:polysaccharide biosynthesis/export protein
MLLKCYIYSLLFFVFLHFFKKNKNYLKLLTQKLLKIMRLIKNLLYYSLLLALLASCRIYNQNIMFKTTKSILANAPLINARIKGAEKNYLIQKGDYLEIRVYTNKGEIIMNPKADANTLGGGMNNMQQQPFLQQQQGGQAGGVAGNQYPLDFPTFLIQQDGTAKIPMIGHILLENLTLNQADSLLETKFSDSFKECFVRTRYSNKRVVVFKGQAGVIYPLRQEKMNLIEILAQTGGMGNDLRASNIRLIRGLDTGNPSVYVINLRTINGLMAQNLVVEPNDIIYVEPVRKSFLEGLNDISPILSFITSLITLGLIFNR